MPCRQATSGEGGRGGWEATRKRAQESSTLPSVSQDAGTLVPMTIVEHDPRAADRAAADNADLLDGITLIDVDSHLSEPHDLWTSRAPAPYRDLVPQVKERKGRRMWVVNGDIPLGALGAASVVTPEGGKALGTSFFRLDVEQVHRASYDALARVEMLDQLGLYAQVMYPNLAGFGNQNFMKVDD